MKPRIVFASNGKCATIHIPLEDEDGIGAITVGGWGFNPLSALKKAAGAARSILENENIAPFLPPQAQLVIKTAAALSNLDQNELEAVAKDADAAPSARKLASVLGDVGSSKFRIVKKRDPNGPRGNMPYVPRGSRSRGPAGRRPQQDQQGQYGYDPYGQPLDQYGQPMDPYGQQVDPYGQPYGQPQYGQPQYPPQYPPPQMMPPQPYYPGYEPSSAYYQQPYYQPQQQQMPAGFNDEYQEAAEQIWGAEAFAQQEGDDQQQYMQDVGDDDQAGDVGDEMQPGCAFDYPED